MNAVFNKIRLLKSIQPNPDWLQSEKGKLLYLISQTGKQSRLSRLTARQAWRVLPGFYLPRFVFKESLALKPVLASLIIFVIIFGSGLFIVGLAKNSLPGDLLYPIKITTENTRLEISSQNTQPLLQAEFVGARVDELTQIIDNVIDPVKKTEQVVKTADKLQAQIINTKVSLDKIKEAQPEKAAEIVQTITERTEQAKEKIAEEFKEEKSEEVAKAIDAIDAALATITGEDKSGIEVQMEVKPIERKVENFPSK